MEQAVVAFYKNDAFYPRPGRDDVKDRKLWNECKDRFLEVSEAILDQGSPEACLPAQLVYLVEQSGRP